MATAKQIASNRSNAKKSTGPTSTAGKEIVSQNRLRHGLCGKFQVLAGVERQEDFDALLNRFMEDEKPVGQAEIELVVKMARHTWLADRALRMQDACFIPQPKTPEQEKSGDTPMGIAAALDDYIRYHTSHDRAYQRASKELLERRKQRLQAEIGFERQKRAEAEEMRKAEKHAVATATANVKKQRLDLKLGKDLTDILPADFDPADLNAILSGAANGAERAF